MGVRAVARRCLLLVTALAPLVGCSEAPWVGHGEVVDRKFVPEHEEWVPAISIPPNCSTNAKGVETCDGGIYVPGYYDTTPDRWWVVVRSAKDGTIVHVGVSHGVYDACRIGDQYDTKQKHCS